MEKTTFDILSNIQRTLFNQIQESSNKETFVDELADCLNISPSGVYRRISAEKMLSFDELLRLALRYNISLDTLLKLEQKGNVLFHFKYPNLEVDLAGYLSNIHTDMQKVLSFADHKVIYSAKDVPIFHFFQFEKLTCFKLYYWLKTMVPDEKYKSLKFSTSLVPQGLINKSLCIYEDFIRLNEDEIWNFNSIESITGQIKYYFETDDISVEDAIALCNELKQLVEHLKEQCNTGIKSIKNKQPASTEVNFRMYFNEIIQSDNTVYTQCGNHKAVYLPPVYMNYITTSDPKFCDYIHDTLNDVISKSEMISVVGEKNRNRFFNHQLQVVSKLMHFLESQQL